MARAEIKIYPSIAAGDLMHLADEVQALEAAGADGIHFDVMDGHFVPLLTIGVPFLQQMRQITKLPLDVHIMVSNPEAVFQDYIEAGADTLTFHVEAATHAHRLLKAIQDKGCKAGISLNPATPPGQLEYLVNEADQITVMGVNPGYSRQKHIESTARKVSSICDLAKKTGGRIPNIMVDGGVNDSNIQTIAAAGAQSFVAGGSVFGQNSYREAIENLKKAARGNRE